MPIIMLGIPPALDFDQLVGLLPGTIVRVQITPDEWSLARVGTTSKVVSDRDADERRVCARCPGGYERESVSGSAEYIYLEFVEGCNSALAIFGLIKRSTFRQHPDFRVKLMHPEAQNIARQLNFVQLAITLPANIIESDSL